MICHHPNYNGFDSKSNRSKLGVVNPWFHHLAVVAPFLHQGVVMRCEHGQAFGTLHQEVGDSVRNSCPVKCRGTPPYIVDGNRERGRN